jgi:hypothetical protein
MAIPDPPFAASLYVQVDVIDHFDGTMLLDPGWCRNMRYLRDRQWVSLELLADQVPSSNEAVRILAGAIANMEANVGFRLRPLGVQPTFDTVGHAGPQVFVTATLEPLSGLGPIPPSGKYPQVSLEGWAKELLLVNAVVWARAIRTTGGEASAAEQLLDGIDAVLPLAAWEPA